MRIEPGQCQMLVAHLQPDLVAQSATERPDMIKRAAGALVDFAVSLGVPVTFSLVPGAGGNAVPIAPLRRFVSDANLFVRQAASPFLDPGVAGRLEAQARPILVVIGFAVEVVVLHAALDAIAAGYSVLVPVDAIGGHSPRTERAALAQIAAAGGTITSALSLLSMLAPDFSATPGKAALEHLKALGDARRRHAD